MSAGTVTNACTCGQVPGRYTHLDGKAHSRVPFGAYKIGRIASGEEVKFLTNDVEHDPRVHDHAWAKSLGLVAFAGYRLKPHDGDVLGVFALFTKFPISPDMDTILEGLSRAISLAIQKEVSDRALTESRQLFSDIISFLPDPTFVIDGDGRVLAWNRALEQLSGISAGDTIGKGDFEYSLWMYGKRRPILIDLVLHPDQDAGRLNYTDIHLEGRTVTAQAEIAQPRPHKESLALACRLPAHRCTGKNHRGDRVHAGYLASQGNRSGTRPDEPDP